jgi:hypothetical protein
MKRKNDSEIIIVKFISHKKKSQLYRARKNLKDVSLTDLFPLIPSDNEIFINENLTTGRRKLLGAALKMKKEKLLTNVWTLDGKVCQSTVWIQPSSSFDRAGAEGYSHVNS